MFTGPQENSCIHLQSRFPGPRVSSLRNRVVVFVLSRFLLSSSSLASCLRGRTGWRRRRRSRGCATSFRGSFSCSPSACYLPELRGTRRRRARISNNRRSSHRQQQRCQVGDLLSHQRLAGKERNLKLQRHFGKGLQVRCVIRELPEHRPHVADEQRRKQHESQT